jgi:pimeloyl-ACP methyl ester carboxylesterase
VGTDVRYTDDERFRLLCPQLRTERLAGCGHYFPLEVPDQLHIVIDRFLRQLISRSEKWSPGRWPRRS